MKKRMLSWMLVLTFIVSLLASATTVSANNEIFSDTSGHWAESAVNRWSKLEIIKGYDGKFSPDDSMIRGDVAVIISRLFGYNTEANDTFDDIDGSEYYASDVLKAKAAGSMNGTSGNLFSPKQKLTRQEAAVLMCNILNINGSDTSVIDFEDKESIADWSKPSVYALVNRGYLSGDGTRFLPESDMTRAEFVTLLDNVFTKVISAETVDNDVYGTVLLSKGNTVLKDIDIKGDLIIAEGVTDGDVTLDNVSVSGNVIVRGGEGSIHIKNESLLSKVCVEYTDGPIHLEVSDNSLIEQLSVLKYGGTVTLEGNYTTVTVNCQAGIKFTNASVENLFVDETAVVSVDGTSYVENSTLNAKGVQLIGVGMVKNCAVNCDNAVILTSKTKVSVSDDANGVKVAGKDVSAGQEVTSPDNTETVNSSYSYTTTEITTEIDWDAMKDSGGSNPETEDLGTITVYFAADCFILGNNVDGFLVNPQKLTVGYGAKASQVIKDCMEKQQFSCDYTGSVESEFYLSSVGGVYGIVPENITYDALPGCLKTYLNGKGYKSDSFFAGGNSGKLKDEDALGEFDYTAQSGWMYSVNGVYPNVGMSNWQLKDGDVIRLTYTLWGWGADIGGGYSAGGAGKGNFYDYNFLTDEIKESADKGNKNISSLAEKAKKIIK